MNDDSDESEYVDDNNASGSDTRTTRGKTATFKKTLKKSSGVKVEATRESPAIVEEAEISLPGGHHSTTTKSVLRSYRDSLNSTILEISGNEIDTSHGHLEPSQIGASYWTVEEKQRFFAALQSRGPGDLLGLATAVGTKSEPEIKAYILLLRQGARELQAKSRLELASADLPAAAEIGAECLQAEEAAAGALEAKARAVEEEKEKARWGEEHWLIDQDAAAALDAQYEDEPEQDDTAENDGTIEDDANANPTVRTSDEADNNPTASLQLLKTSILLQLSRSVFMNSKDPSSNWHTLTENDPTGPDPSIRRTALEDFHSLAVSLTRRLVQVSIFQAFSRLRASSDPRVQPNVHVFDVVAARETMGLKLGGPEYWARAVERCGVEVYADTKKYRAEDGRKGTKVGYKLSENELRMQLGISTPEASKHANDTSDTIGGEEDGDDDLDGLDSDAYKDTGSSEQSLPDNDDDLSEDEDEDRKHPIPHRRTGSKNRLLSSRKRPLSPASFARAETRHLEDLDRMQSTAGENELRSVLELDLLPEKEELKPDFHFKLAEVETSVEDWRELVQYEAPWEQAGGVPKKREFDLMDMEGDRRRKRRRAIGSSKTGDGIDSDEVVESESAEETGGAEEEGDESDAGSGKDQSSAGSDEEDEEEEEEEEED
jgi:RNA polymerase I-specific transcription initiation factor RRN5